MPQPPTDATRRAAKTATDLAGLAVNVYLTKRRPVSLVHFVTRRCNARCSFCFIDFDHPSSKSAELTTAEVDTLTKHLGSSLQNVNLTGGEPFLRGDLIDIARSYYTNTGVRSVYITSNGAYPDRALGFARSVASEFPDRMLFVSLSVDALPEEHNRIRKVDGLFDKVLETYHGLAAIGGGVSPNIAITVSHENHAAVPDLYDYLIDECGVGSITAIIVRDEGVYEVPVADKKAIVASYQWLTQRIGTDQASGRLAGYDPKTVQGRLMNRKNEMLWEMVADTYVEPQYISPCHAGALFGVIDADGSVHPCEVLDRPLGNLRDVDMDFERIWDGSEAAATRKWIRDTDCHCTYECALGFNILGNARYQPRLLSAAIPRPR